MKPSSNSTFNNNNQTAPFPIERSLTSQLAKIEVNKESLEPQVPWLTNTNNSDSMMSDKKSFRPDDWDLDL